MGYNVPFAVQPTAPQLPTLVQRVPWLHGPTLSRRLVGTDIKYFLTADAITCIRLELILEVLMVAGRYGRAQVTHVDGHSSAMMSVLDHSNVHTEYRHTEVPQVE